MSTPRTVHMFLMDGAPTGRIKCSLDNWVGKVYLIPRTEIAQSKDRPELNQTGIYLLFGSDSATGDDLVYVGQARERKDGNGVLGRVAEHLGEEKHEYFTHAIIIITSDDSFGPTEISYLENAFYRLACAADRVRTVNGNDPSPGNVTEEKQAALDEFISFATILIGSLGYRVFDAVDEAKANSPVPSVTPPLAPEPLLSLHSSVASGQGRHLRRLCRARGRIATPRSDPFGTRIGPKEPRTFRRPNCKRRHTDTRHPIHIPLGCLRLPHRLLNLRQDVLEKRTGRHPARARASRDQRCNESNRTTRTLTPPR